MGVSVGLSALAGGAGALSDIAERHYKEWRDDELNAKQQQLELEKEARIREANRSDRAYERQTDLDFKLRNQPAITQAEIEAQRAKDKYSQETLNQRANEEGVLARAKAIPKPDLEAGERQARIEKLQAETVNIRNKKDSLDAGKLSDIDKEMVKRAGNKAESIMKDIKALEKNQKGLWDEDSTSRLKILQQEYVDAQTEYEQLINKISGVEPEQQPEQQKVSPSDLLSKELSSLNEAYKTPDNISKSTNRVAQEMKDKPSITMVIDGKSKNLPVYIPTLEPEEVQYLKENDNDPSGNAAIMNKIRMWGSKADPWEFQSAGSSSAVGNAVRGLIGWATEPSRTEQQKHDLKRQSR